MQNKYNKRAFLWQEYLAGGGVIYMAVHHGGKVGRSGELPY